MFSLKQTVKIANVNARAELHGDEHVIAVDIKIDAKVSNDLLAEFHPDLKSLLYVRDDAPVQPELDMGDPNRASKLRFANMLGSIKWGWEGAGYHLTVEQGVTAASNIVLGDCEVDHFHLHPQEGGSVGVVFRVIAHPEPDDIGALCALIQQEVTIELTPPSPAEAADMTLDKVKRELEEVE